MPKTIISDTSCLILLDKIGSLHLLQNLYETIITTKEVANEYGIPFPSWISIQQPINKSYQDSIEGSLDKRRSQRHCVSC